MSQVGKGRDDGSHSQRRRAMGRRTFIRAVVGGTAAGGVSSCARGAHRGQRPGVSAAIPIPIQVVIDDVGWWSGQDGSAWEEPYRSGMPRNHVPADYEAIVHLGRALGMCPQAATVLCEWDKANILRKVPTATWMGEAWDNTKWVGPWLEEAAHIITSNPRHYELTVHGVGHEYWEDGKASRAEWADNEGRMRPRDQVKAHLDCFNEILDQHNLGPFPTSFVPAAFRHTFGPSEGEEESLAGILSRRGVTSISTPFRIMQNAEAVRHGFFDYDAGVMTIDRGTDLLPWDMIGPDPEGVLEGPICGMHWPHVLHSDPERNLEVVDRWVGFLKPYNDRIDTFLSPNTEAMCRQLPHQQYTRLALGDRTIKLDFTDLDRLHGPVADDVCVVKVQSPSKLAFSPENLELGSSSAKELDGSTLYTLEVSRLDGRKQAELRFSHQT